MDGSTYGLPARVLATLTGVHIDTARRWTRAGKIPRAYRELVRWKLEGDLGAVAHDWNGFSIRDGTLVTPEGVRIAPGDVRAIPYRRAQVRELEQRLAEPQQWKLL